jgi:7-carboxy-7-deazaguanine synthase
MTNSSTLPVMEMFYTLQGEGFYKGTAAYFIRLGGCDVGCVWCDVKDSWDATKHPQLSVDEIVNKAVIEIESFGTAYKTNPPIFVITGGEPLMHNLDNLTAAIKAKGFKTNIETSASSPISGSWDWICVSPKKFKAPIDSILPLANELKIVVYNKSDFAWAESYAKQVNSNCKLYLQAEWDKKENVTPVIIDYIKANPKWQLSVQIHKYINVP